MWGAYYNIPKAIFYLLRGHYRVNGIGGLEVEGSRLRVVVVKSTAVYGQSPQVHYSGAFPKSGTAGLH